MGEDVQQPGCLQLLTRLGAAAAAVASIAGLVFLLFPRLKPADPVQKRDAALSDLQVHFERAGNDAVLVYFKAQIDGYPGARLPVLWTLYDADADTPVDSWPLSPPVLGAYTTRHQGPTLTPTLPSESFSGEVRIPGRPRVDRRSWKVEIEITDPAGNRLTRAETPPFTVPESFAQRP